MNFVARLSGRFRTAAAGGALLPACALSASRAERVLYWDLAAWLWSLVSDCTPLLVLAGTCTLGCELTR